MFGDEFNNTQDENVYTSKIQTPIYEPKNKKPHPLELYDATKANKLINEIMAADLPEDEKKFLSEAAKRHIVFNYERIADYYAHSNPEVQRLMEKSALVIVDYNKAYSFGYVQLAIDTANKFFSDEE